MQGKLPDAKLLLICFKSKFQEDKSELRDCKSKFLDNKSELPDSKSKLPGEQLGVRSV